MESDITLKKHLDVTAENMSDNTNKHPLLNCTMFAPSCVWSIIGPTVVNLCLSLYRLLLLPLQFIQKVTCMASHRCLLHQNRGNSRENNVCMKWKTITNLYEIMWVLNGNDLNSHESREQLKQSVRSTVGELCYLIPFHQILLSVQMN